MIQFLPLIFKALTAAPGLIDSGKEIYEAVTGNQSAATTPEELQSEIHALPPEQAQAWLDHMKVKVDLYKAETDRLRNEQGDITDTMIAKLGPEAAAEIAKERMTTRPRVVWLLTRGMVYPMAFLFAVDGTLAVLNTVSAGFGWTRGDGSSVVLIKFDLIAGQFFSGDSVYAVMYGDYVPWAAGIIGGYMTLREIGKSGHKNPISGAINAVKAMLGK